MNILIIEDEKDLLRVLEDLLKREKYSVDSCGDGISGQEYALSGIYDVILLDIMLPGQSGLELLREIRSAGIGAPVLLLTAKSQVEDKILGLDSGADDYLTKPFSTGELLARIRALTRRRDEFTGDELRFGGTSLSSGSFELSCNGNSVTLGQKEFQILELLMANSKSIIPKERFIEKIWGFNTDAEYNAVEVYVSFLRKKLQAIGSKIQIKAVRGIGYCLEEKDNQ